MRSSFTEFGHSHLAVLVTTALLPLALAGVARLLPGKKFARAVSLTFAAELIATWILWFGLILVRGWISMATVLPMNLCDWATIATTVTLLGSGRKTFELAYFWTFSGTLQALITPELYYDFPDLRFIVFFAFHGGTIAAVCFLCSRAASGRVLPECRG